MSEAKNGAALTGTVQPLVMFPMETAPRDGTRVLIRVKTVGGLIAFYNAKWRDKYSVNSDDGAWQHETDYEMDNTLDRRCEGWLPIPDKHNKRI